MSPPDRTQKLASGGTLIQATPERPVKSFAPGDVLAGIYRIDRKIGEGGMSVVLAATHLPTNRVMAVKVLHAEAAGAEGATARFWREARAVSRLQNPHVVGIFEVGMLADDTPYMAMELLDGETLWSRMQRLGPLPIDTAKDYFHQACDAVTAAHAIGVIHRDLKPENMFLTQVPGGEVLKILDFGISKTMRATVSDDQQKLTKTTDVFGSPSYMSPEQLRASRDVDARTDVWSLGVILYEMLTGVGPFDAGSVAEIFGAILYKAPRPPSSIRADIPREIDAAVMRALDKDVNKRFATVRDLEAAIESASPRGQLAPGAPAPASAQPAPASRSMLPLIALAVLIVAAAVSYVVARWLS